MSLYNGTAVLSSELPINSQIGDKFEYKLIVHDTCTEKTFEEIFSILVIPYQENDGGNGARNGASGERGDGKSLRPSGIALPQVAHVTKEEWDEPEFNFNQNSALSVKKVSGDNNVYDFFIDNVHLQLELMQVAKEEAKVRLTKARYEYGMVLIGMGILGYYSKNDTEKNEDDVTEVVRKHTEMISPILLPMINVLGGYDFDKLIQE